MRKVFVLLKNVIRSVGISGPGGRFVLIAALVLFALPSEAQELTRDQYHATFDNQIVVKRLEAACIQDAERRGNNAESFRWFCQCRTREFERLVPPGEYQRRLMPLVDAGRPQSEIAAAFDAAIKVTLEKLNETCVAEWSERKVAGEMPFPQAASVPASEGSSALADGLALNREGMAAYQRGDVRDAARLFGLSVQSLNRAIGERHPNTLASMSNLAFAFGALGRTAEQLTLNEKVLRLMTETLGERHVDTLTSMGNLAETYGAVGRTAERLALNEKVLRLRTEILGERHPATLVSMHNLAQTYGSLGRTTEQVALSDKALRLMTEALGERHPNTLKSMGSLAQAYGALGRTAEQLSLSEKVLRLMTDVLGERHPDTLTSMNDLASAYGALGRSAEQLALNEKVLRLQTETLGERHPDTLASMHNLAFAYGAVGRTNEQLALNEKALRLHTEVLGERHSNTLASASNLAFTYGELGRTAEQLALIEKVLRLRTDVLGERHPDSLVSMHNLASTYRALGRSAEGVALSEKVLRLMTETLGDRHPTTLTVMRDVAYAYAVGGRLPDAAVLSARYVAGGEWQRSQPGLSPENRQSVFKTYAAGYRLFSNVHGSIGKLDEALHLSELSKARTLLETIASNRAARGGALPASQLGQFDSLNRQAGVLDQQIAQASTPETRQNLEATRNEVVRQYQALQTHLKQEYPKYAQLSDVTLVSTAELRGLLPTDTLAVSYLVSGEVVSAFLVESTGQLIYRPLGKVPHIADLVEIVRLGQSEAAPLKEILAEQARRAWKLADGSYRLLEASQAAPQGASELTDAREVVQYVSSKLLLPLAKELQSRPRWIISPDGPLAQLSFEALPFGEKSEPAIASAEIHYTQSLSVYALSRNLQRQYEGLKGRQSLFAMGNPDYGLKSLNPRERRNLQRNANVRGSHSLSELDGLWKPLPGTEAEVKAVAELFRGSASTYLGPQATEQQLRALNDKGLLKNYRYLLMSAHGYLSADQPSLSSIVLGVGSRTVEDDGYVTAAEWPGYDLRSDLMVLSACDSGVGKVVSGEGVMGLPFALFVAGNVNTVLTLWPVHDQATAEFVTSLFTKLKAGHGATQALAATKREFMRHKRFSHPSFWAPFVLIGAG